MNYSKNNLLSQITYINLVRCWLTGVLLLLPFHIKIAKSNILADIDAFTYLRYIDEITIIVFLPLAIIEFIRNKEIRDWVYIIILLPLFLLCIGGLISGFINGNPLHITALGTLDYIRNFLVIFIYAAFFRGFSQFKTIFRLLLILAVFIGVIAFIQELWAITSQYYFTEGSNSKIYLMLQSLLPDYSEIRPRLGIYRVLSVMDNFNFMGLYCLLILTVYIYSAKKVKFPIFLALFAGVFGSVSRMVYMGFMFIAGLRIFRTKRKRIIMVLAMIPILILMFRLIVLWDINLPTWIKAQQVSESGMLLSENEINATSYRKYSKDKAVAIWGDYPLWGVGPGKFGGIISVKFNSYIYEEYNFLGSANALLNNWKHIDQFWPMILAEMGVVGMIFFTTLLISLLMALLRARKRATSYEMKGTFEGLGAFIIVILFYSLGSPINITPVIFPYFALVGMGLGSVSVSHK